MQKYHHPGADIFDVQSAACLTAFEMICEKYHVNPNHLCYEAEGLELSYDEDADIPKEMREEIEKVFFS